MLNWLLPGALLKAKVSILKSKALKVLMIFVDVRMVHCWLIFGLKVAFPIASPEVREVILILNGLPGVAVILTVPLITFRMLQPGSAPAAPGAAASFTSQT